MLSFLSCKTNKQFASKSTLNVEKISLSERTRGTNRSFTFSDKKLETSINGNITVNELSSLDWTKINSFTEKINLEEISKLEAPSTKRYSDAALASEIAIFKDGKEYNSSAFDSGNPPLELKNLYEELQRIIETKKSK